MQLAWLKTGHIRHGGRYENKNTTDGFHQPSSTNLDTYLAFAADSWCWKSLSLSWSHIWGVGTLAWWESEWPDIRMPKGPHYSLHASDEWGTGLPIYLNFTAESVPHRAAAATFLSRLSCSPADRTRYSRTDTEGPLLGVLRLNPEISAENREILLAKTTRPL